MRFGFLVDVLDIHNKDVIEEAIGISASGTARRDGHCTVKETVDTCCFLDGRRDGCISLREGRKADFR